MMEQLLLGETQIWLSVIKKNKILLFELVESILTSRQARIKGGNMLTWQKLVLYPLAIWVVIYLFICALIGFKISTTADWVMMVTTLISVVGLFIASKSAKLDVYKNVIILALVWVLVMFALDLVLTVPFVPNYLASWKTYFNYGLTLVMPLIFAKRK